MKRLVPFLIALAAGCAGGTPLPPGVLQTMSSVCVSQGMTQAACDCYAEELKKRITYEDWIKFESDSRNKLPLDPKIAKAQAEAAAICAGK